MISFVHCNQRTALWHESRYAKTSDSYYVDELAPYVVFTSSSRHDSTVKLPESSLSRGSSCRSRESSASQTDHTLGRNAGCNADTTLYGSTQTAAVLAELAAEHGDQTFNADDTLADCESVGELSMRPIEKIPFIGVEPLASDGFCLQSAEEEVKNKLTMFFYSFHSST